MSAIRTKDYLSLTKCVAAMLLAIVGAISSVPTAAIAGQQQHVDQSAASDLEREMRVARVGYRLSRAAVGLCDHPEPITGMVLHDIGSYAEADRSAVSRAYHLGRGFGVRLVVVDGAAARSGIRTGDEIVSLDGQELATFAPELIGHGGSPARTERFIALLRDVLASGHATLGLERSDGLHTIILVPDSGCSGKFVVTPSSELNGWSDGTGVAITSRLVDFLRDDDELAYILAHEMGHNILHHAERTKGHSILLASVGIGAGLIKTTEIEADKFAVKLMLLARYDPVGGERFLRRLSTGAILEIAFTHQGSARRIETLREARAALTRKQQADSATASRQSNP